MAAEAKSEDNDYKPFSIIIHALNRACRERKSGTMYVLTDEGDGATFTIVKGKILQLIFRDNRGMKALEQVKNISHARYLFSNDPSLERKFTTNTEYLPANNIIFRKLGMRYDYDPMYPWMGDEIRKILVVEDSSMSRKAIVNIFNGESYEIFEAKDGVEAMRQLPEVLPDLVLLDLILPIMDGYDVLSAMKSDAKLKNIPVIMLTSRDALFDKLRGKMSGTDEYITKPIDADELKRAVSKYVH